MGILVTHGHVVIYTTVEYVGGSVGILVLVQAVASKGAVPIMRRGCFEVPIICQKKDASGTENVLTCMEPAMCSACIVSRPPPCRGAPGDNSGLKG